MGAVGRQSGSYLAWLPGSGRHNVEITIGSGAAEDDLFGTANLVQKPAGSGKWRLRTEP